jgi:hypothetical protein
LILIGNLCLIWHTAEFEEVLSAANGKGLGIKAAFTREGGQPGAASAPAQVSFFSA